MEYGCSGFCKGGKNTENGFVAISQTTDRKVKYFKDGTSKCPLGCLHYPSTKKAAVNLKKNGATLGDICRANPFRFA